MRRRFHGRLTLLIAMFALVVIVPGQTVQHQLYTFSGDSVADYFGSSVAGAGDVNQDGYDDLIVGARHDDDNGASSGSARVLSGLDGTVLYTFHGAAANEQLGYSVDGAGDVNMDGFADVVVGGLSGFNGLSAGGAWVFSGVDGSVLYTFYGDSAGDLFGTSVAGAGDVNMDGYDDVVVGAHLDDDNGVNAGSVKVFSGIDGSVLYTFDGDATYDLFGVAVAGAGDVNQDGYADVVVGAHGDDDNGAESGSVRVLSGIDGSVLYTFYGDSAGDWFGRAVAGVGDVNQDGNDDVLVGAMMDDDKGVDTGSARVLSGADGSILFTLYGDPLGSNFGQTVAGIGDVNEDGHDDFVVGRQSDNQKLFLAGRARVFSGFNGLILYTFYGDAIRDFLGVSVAGAGDVNQDGYPDLIVGAPGEGVTGSQLGFARVLSGKMLSLRSDIHELPSWKAGTQNLTIDAGKRHAGREYWMFGSVSGTNPGTQFANITIPLNLDTWTLVELSFLNTPALTNFQGQLDANGRAAARVNLPPGLPASLGFTMYHVYVVHNANFVPFMASNAMPLRIR